jgi:hypothetical protein
MLPAIQLGIIVFTSLEGRAPSVGGEEAIAKWTPGALSQAQHRWAVKSDDPKLLDEIDTVFVTLEPAGWPFATPTGKPLLEAYFGTPPNHP